MNLTINLDKQNQNALQYVQPQKFFAAHSVLGSLMTCSASFEQL